jgi:branched-chain amino acid aminotransferase
MARSAVSPEPVQSGTNRVSAEVVYCGGAFRPASEAAVSVFDHGLLYGDGIFEGIRAYNGRIFKLDRHIDRLLDSAKAIRLALPLSARAIADLVIETCRRNAIVDGYIRLIVTRGAGHLGIDPRSCREPNVIVIARPIPSFYADGAAAKGATLVTSMLRRPAPDALSPSIKSLNYLNNVLARIEANDAGADEALLLDAQGYVAEATADNIFMQTDQGCFTPPTATNLKGITRETVIEIARDLGVTIVESRFTLTDVWTAREVWMCGTGAEIVPIRAVDGRMIGNGAVGPLARKIIDAYHRLVRTTGTEIGEGLIRTDSPRR